MTGRPTILLVDDSENDIVLMRAAFTMAKSGITLTEARNGEEAMAYLKGEGSYSDRSKFPLPTVMLLDLNMPKKNGFEVLEWTRSQPGLKRLAIIVLTASMRTEDLERAFDLGATSFLVKPSNLDALAAMMRCLCDWVQINHFPSLTKI
ncbi:MAG TPA: response regulator [Candidatus Saccharimonadales bacterium]|nr:response regulator [Candidatus Saccharimonadales bacterium]